MANKRRGEVQFEVDGRKYTLCMTLGAMAEIEDIFELESITELSTVFTGGKFKVRQLISLLGALMRGGGEDITDEEIMQFDLNAMEAFGAAMEAVNVQAGKEEPNKGPKKKAAAKRKK